MPKIGEFELLVVLAILRQADAPYANQVRRDLEDNAKRSVTRGALYRTLDRLKEKGLDSWILTGDLKEEERKKTIEALHEGRIKVLIATGQLIGHGFDYNGFSSLFLGTPLKYFGRLIQYVGRVMRPGSCRPWRR